MTILVFSSTLYTCLADGLPSSCAISWIFSICNWLRTLGFVQVAFYLALYERFHSICLETREKEMEDAGLSEGMHFSRRGIMKNAADYFMVPLVVPLFGSIPCAQAQISHFWTLDLVYSVSKKVTRQRSHSMGEGLTRLRAKSVQTGKKMLEV